MVLRAVKEILLRAGTDPDFRAEFFNNRQRALTGFELTDEEIQCLAEVKAEEQLATICQKVGNEDKFRMTDIRI